jgi:hypothetical protein
MAWRSSLDVIREMKEQHKRQREARRAKEAQIRWNRRLARKGLISSPPRLMILDAKTLSQMDAATRLNCVIGAWESNCHVD